MAYNGSLSGLSANKYSQKQKKLGFLFIIWFSSSELWFRPFAHYAPQGTCMSGQG